MKRSAILANSILWAAAIVASAIVFAPQALTLMILPALAAASLVLTVREERQANCGW